MRPTSLLHRVLGFSRVSILSVRFVNDAIVVGIKFRGRSRCSRCGRKAPRYDRRTRRWRHLDVCTWPVFLEGALARVNCPACGVVIEGVTFASPRSDFTHAFEDMVGWLAQRCDKTTISAMMRITWRTVGRIVERVIERRRGPIETDALTAISVDELSYRKGHRYLTIVTDLVRGRVIWTAEGKSADTLSAFFREIGGEACARIEHVAIDMSQAYTKAVRECVPNAELVYDHFHVVQLLSDAVDEVRRSEWRQTEKGEAKDAIKRTRYLLLRRPWNTTVNDREKLSIIAKQNKRLYRAYMMKEAFCGIYDRRLKPGWARRRFKEWLAWASRSKLEPFVKVARTIRGHSEGILAFFKTGFTTAMSEGLNNKARTATRQAYGFHSASAVRAMIELRCSGLTVPLPHLP